MRLFLDDLRDVPDGWVGVRTAPEAIALVMTGDVDEISFDHDLGDPFDTSIGNGYDVAKAIEEGAFDSRLQPIRWRIHSGNPVGRKNIEQAMLAAERFWKMKS